MRKVQPSSYDWSPGKTGEVASTVGVMSQSPGNQLAFFLAAVFLAAVVFFAAAFFVAAFFVVLFDADFRAGFASASSSSSGTSSPRPFLAAATERWRAAR